MKLLICTPVFFPSVGGLETVNVLLSEKLTREGHEVVLVTPSLSKQPDSFSFTVVRNPSMKTLRKLYRWCDIFIHNAIVLKYVLPALNFRKPFFVVHHSCTYNWDQTHNIQSVLKSVVSAFAHNIVVSESVARSLRLRPGYRVINNFYDSSTFELTNKNERKDFVYVGRLSTEKGVSLLIRAYKNYLDRQGLMRLRIVGDGYDRPRLEALTDELGVSENVDFLGIMTGSDLRNLLNESRALVLPSICKEAFGIVILEAMACGCYCIGSDGDGIQEAMGSLGRLFNKSDVDSLTEALLEMDQSDYSCYQKYLEKVKEYLTSFSVDVIAQKWISAFMSAL